MYCDATECVKAKALRMQERMMRNYEETFQIKGFKCT